MNNQRGAIPLLVLALLAIVIGSGVYFVTINRLNINPENGIPPTTVITSFEECTAAGYPVMESYPRQCRTLDGKNFTEVIASVNACATVLCPADSTCKDGTCVKKNVAPQNLCLSVTCVIDSYCDSATGKCVQEKVGSQGIYGITYWVSGQEKVEGNSKGGYFAEIPVFKMSRRPAPGTQNVSPQNADVIIKSDSKGNYRLALSPGEYCAWDDAMRNCFTADLTIQSGQWKNVNFTIFGQ